MKPEELQNIIAECIARLEREVATLTGEVAGLEKVADSTAARVRLSSRLKELTVRQDSILDLEDLAASVKGLVVSREDGQEKATTFYDMVALLDTREMREEGRWLGLMVEGAEKVKADWGEYHEYADGKVDRILLNGDTVRGSDDE